jgi:hypothetical protein
MASGTMKRLLMLGLGLLVGGCAAPPATGLRDTPLPKEATFWQPWLLNSARSPYRKLYVEVDAVQGAEPPQPWLDDLSGFLSRQCDKPDGVRIVRSNTIPKDEARTASIASLALRYMDGPPPGAAFIYILYYNSALNPALKTTNPQAVVFPYPCAILVDRNYNMAGFGDVLGGLILKHEAGHLVGAAREPSHGDGAHCGYRGCLMNPNFEATPQRIAQGSTTGPQSGFCKNCLWDMARWRATPTPGNLRFHGPFLARREIGYTVLTLPNAVHLHLGTTESLPVDQLRTAVRLAAAGPMRSKEGCIVSGSAVGSKESVQAALNAAAKDPASSVRQSAQALAAKLATPAPPNS